MNEDPDDILRFDLELSSRETFSIGAMVSLWGALEYEIFSQTLKTFVTPGDTATELPKEMNNARFSKVLELWKERVVDKADAVRRNVLTHQYEKIVHYNEARHALVHGMWAWDPRGLQKITTTRVRNRKIIHFHFTADDLSSFIDELRRINFKVRWPGGIEDYVANAFPEDGQEEGSLHIGRKGAALLTNHPLVNDFFPSLKNIHDRSEKQGSEDSST